MNVIVGSLPRCSNHGTFVADSKMASAAADTGASVGHVTLYGLDRVASGYQYLGCSVVCGRLLQTREQPEGWQHGFHK